MGTRSGRERRALRSLDRGRGRRARQLRPVPRYHADDRAVWPRSVRPIPQTPCKERRLIVYSASFFAALLLDVFAPSSMWR